MTVYSERLVESALECVLSGLRSSPWVGVSFDYTEDVAALAFVCRLTRVFSDAFPGVHPVLYQYDDSSDSLFFAVVRSDADPGWSGVLRWLRADLAATVGVAPDDERVRSAFRLIG